MSTFRTFDGLDTTPPVGFASQLDDATHDLAATLAEVVESAGAVEPQTDQRQPAANR